MLGFRSNNRNQLYWMVGAVFSLSCLAVQPAQAGIINGGSISGFGTFIDQNTGYTWMDMNSFFGQTSDYMIAAASGAGFQFATKSEVQTLLGSLSLAGSEWSSIYKPFMMDAPNRELIWGVYNDGGDPYGWAYAYDNEQNWTFVDNVVSGNSVPNANTEVADMNIWAYHVGGGSSVPLPGTFALFGLGLVGLGWSRRKQA